VLRSTVERAFEGRLLIHRNLEDLRRVLNRRDRVVSDVVSPEPTLNEAWREHERHPPVYQDEEATELVALCLWDIF
jgi:hypothetical protein